MLRLDINLLFTVINLLVWYLLIRKFLFKPVNRVIEKREQAIASRYEEAKKAEDEAKAQKEKYEALEEGIRDEKAKVMQQAEEDARAAYRQIVAEANQKAEQILSDSRRSAEQEHAGMVRRAEREIRSMLSEAACESVRRETDNSGIYDQFLKKAGEANDTDR